MMEATDSLGIDAPAGRAPPVLFFLLATAVLVVLGASVWVQARRDAGARELVAHTLLVQQAASRLETELLSAESQHRAYLLLGDEDLLRGRGSHLREARETLARLRALTRDNPTQQARLARIERLLAEREARMGATTSTAAEAGLDAARARFAAEGPGSLEPVGDAVAGFTAAESALYRQRAQAAAEVAARLRWWPLLAPAAGVLLLALGLRALLAQLRRSERAGAQLRRALALLDATYDAVLIYDADSLAIRYVNQGALDQLGFTRSELISMDILQVKRGIGPEWLRRQLQPLLDGSASSVSFESRHRRRDGSELPVEVSARLVRLDDGAASVATVARDISARKRAEDERDRFFSLSLDMLCIASADGYFKRLSPAFTRTLGWSLEEMLGRPFIEFVHPDDQAATLAEVERQMRDREPVLDFENRFLCRDGGWRLLSWKSAPQLDGSMYATARDITERREAEQRVVALNSELLERQAALEAANRELESFSYSVSHDLRAPLRHVDGYARMLREDVGPTLPGEARRYLDTIVDSARRMGMLIDDLLAFSRLGRKPLSSRPIDMTELARGALEEVRSQVGSGPTPATVEIGPLPAAAGDPVLLRQVWANLLANALKYSRTRGDEARVRIAGERRGDLLHYSVTDNGVGFDMRYADKLFGVFQRLHAQDEFEGTGVGLAIVQRIVGRHGGMVSATAEPGRGACFSFQLPIAEIQG
jgi:PAS domain S-box-containing protein